MSANNWGPLVFAIGVGSELQRQALGRSGRRGQRGHDVQRRQRGSRRQRGVARAAGVKGAPWRPRAARVRTPPPEGDAGEPG